MRDYINRLSRGSSIIKVPKLSCSEEQITMDIMCNTVATGSFICDATDKVYGMVYADNERVKILSEQFGGTHIITEYQVDASGLEENDEIEGTFTVVCNAGEKKIPFVFRCMKENQDDIRNHVKTEAVVLHIDNEENTIIHKDEAEQFECVLIKSGTEETEIDIYADADFIELEKDSLSTDDFAGDRAVIKYIVNPQKMHAGNNYGYIHIVSYTQHLKINVSVICKKADESEDFEVRTEEKLARYKLTKLYLDFRTKVKSFNDFIAESKAILEDGELENLYDNSEEQGRLFIEYQVTRAMLYGLNGEGGMAQSIITSNEELLKAEKERKSPAYFTAIFIYSLIDDSKDVRDTVFNEFNYVLNDIDHTPWQVLYYEYQLDEKRNDNGSMWLARFKDAYSEGCTSPIIYIEAIQILNRQPVLLRMLNSFEIQVLNYASDMIF